LEVKVLPCDTTAGWALDAGTTASVNEWPDYVSGYHSGALMLASGVAAAGGAQADVSVPVSGLSWLTLTATSVRKATGPIRRASDAKVTITLTLDGVQVPFYVPTYSHAYRVRLPLQGAALLTRIRVDFAAGDRLVLSNVLAVREDMPLDLLNAVKSALELRRDVLMGRGIRLGTLTCAAGDRRVTVATDWSWLERYAVFTVGDGAEAETHQADNATGASFTLGRAYGGPAMLRNHAAAPVYLTFPVEVGRFDTEVRLPGLCVWHSSPGPATITSRLTERLECFRAGDAVLVRDGARVAWRVMIDHEARSPELVAYMTQACRALMASGVLWVHGVKCWFEWSEPAVDAEPDMAYDILPRSAYALTAEVREDSWPPRIITASGPASLQVRPSP
jgi:hypothetical protein